MTRQAMRGDAGAGAEQGQDQEDGGNDEQAADGGRPATHRASRVDGLENTGLGTGTPTSVSEATRSQLE
jgi:hypothetical protein